MVLKRFLLLSITALILFIAFTSSIFASDKLAKIQQAIKNKNAKWTAAENPISKLTPEAAKKLLGAFPESVNFVSSKLITLPHVDNLPDSLDWRNNNGNWVTPVKSQGECGSCWDFSAVGQVESWWMLHNNRPDSMIDLSEQFVLSCSAGGCNGWWASNALEFIKNTGVPLESCFEYAADDAIPCEEACENWQEQAVKIPGWGYITGDEAIVDNIKNALLRHPVSANFSIYEDFRSYSSGVYEHVWGDYEGGHAILIVGWNDREQSWICKNSWDEDWGEDGYFRIKWGEVGIGTNMPFIWDTLIASPSISVSTDTIKFNMPEDDSSIQYVTIRNVGAQNLEYVSLDEGSNIYFHKDDFHAYDNLSWWCGDPAIEGYHNHWLQYLDTPNIDIYRSFSPSMSCVIDYAVEYPAGAPSPYDGWDGCNIWLSTDGGENFEVAYPHEGIYTCASLWGFGHPNEGWNMGPNIPGWAGKSGEFIEVALDLTPFKSKTLVLRFAFASDRGHCTIDDSNLFGFIVDEITVKDGDNTIFTDTAIGETGMRTSGFGLGSADWLSISNGSGVINPSGSENLGIEVNTSGLQEGDYFGRITINSNDNTQPEVQIPVQLTVDSSTPADDTSPRELPRDFALRQNYPNPFNACTKIEYSIPTSGSVKISIFTINGTRIRELNNTHAKPGVYSITWDGRDENAALAGSGLYMYRLEVNGQFYAAKKLLLVK